MAEDWAVDVKKYVPNADDSAIAGIVRHCGIALRKRDSQLVSFTDKTETDLVRESFLKKKCGLTDSDAKLDAQIKAVGVRMKADKTRNRVTVYYLLAEHYKKLALFQKATKATKAAKVTTAASKTTKTAKVAAGVGVAAVAGAAAKGAKKTTGAVASGAKKATGAAAAVGATALGVAGAAASGAKDTASAAVSGAGAAVLGAGAVAAGAAGAAVSGIGGAASAGAAKIAGAMPDVHMPSKPSVSKGWLSVLLALLAICLLLWLLHSCTGQNAANTAAPMVDASASASAAATPAASTAAAEAAIPAGAGISSDTVDGKPRVKVFFATGKIDVAPAFVPAADGLKAYLVAHGGSSLTVSGFADKSGDPAKNAALSKSRAEAVKAALVSAGIADGSVALVKPDDKAVAVAGDKAAARRVEVNIK